MVLGELLLVGSLRVGPRMDRVLKIREAGLTATEEELTARTLLMNWDNDDDHPMASRLLACSGYNVL